MIEGFQGLKDMPSQSRVIIGVKRMGELDQKPFIKECQRVHANQVHTRAAEACSSWQEKLKNPEWHPFRVQDCGGVIQRVLDDDDKILRGLTSEWGLDVFLAVVTALEELQEYNPGGCYPVLELWNFKEKRKATMEEVINHMFSLLKTLKRKRVEH